MVLWDVMAEQRCLWDHSTPSLCRLLPPVQLDVIDSENRGYIYRMLSCIPFISMVQWDGIDGHS